MKYSSKEIIDMAVKIEETGYTFYRECAVKFEIKPEGASEMFLLLAEEELKHRDYFRELLSQVSDIEGVFDDTYYSYLKALTQTQVFKDISDISKVLSSVSSIQDVLRIALQTEKDSIIWYRELQSLYGENDTETFSILVKLIDEEKKHIVLINNLMLKIIV